MRTSGLDRKRMLRGPMNEWRLFRPGHPQGGLALSATNSRRPNLIRRLVDAKAAGLKNLAGYKSSEPRTQSDPKD